MGLIGTYAYCFVPGVTGSFFDDPGMMYIYPDAGWTMAPGSTLTLLASQTTLVDAATFVPFTGSVTISASCAYSHYPNSGISDLSISVVTAACSPPVPVINGPSSAYPACVGQTSAAALNWDGLGSFDFYGKVNTFFVVPRMRFQVVGLPLHANTLHPRHRSRRTNGLTSVAT